jgi:CDP-diacylglycerol pyrophosphatase
VVHDLCVVDIRTIGLPAPCAKVDLAGGYAVLKDLRGRTQMLLIPTQRVSGVESPLLLGHGLPNYFALAWRNRSLFEHRAGRPVPREDIALAINSVPGRTQNQLHIHIDCIRPDVRAALAAAAPRLGPWWSAPDLVLAGRRYRALRLEGEALTADPFALLAALPTARADMADETLVVAGALLGAGRPGFILLSRRGDPAKGDPGSGEELLDHSCRVLSPADEARALAAAPPPSS